jgi:surface antigen
MDMCNCTSYVAWALQANGQRIDWFIAGAMNAGNWPHVARLARLRVVEHPRPGAVAVFPKLSPPFGHVAYVTAVDPDGGFDVSEYNFPPGAAGRRFRFDQRHDVPVRGVVFIEVPRASPTRTHSTHLSRPP